MPANAALSLFRLSVAVSGLDSDSENEGGVTGGSAKPEAKEEAAPPPKQRDPPRLLELLDLNPDSKEDTDVTGGPAKSTVEYHITKLPNLVGLVGDKPYDAKTYDAAKEEEEYRGYVHNMIRWRYKLDADGKKLRDADGKLVRESNTRLVKWSDGSYTLHVGQGQALEVETLDSSYPDDHPDATLAGFAGINGYLYTSKEGQMRPLKEGTARDPPEGGAAAKEKDDGDAPPPVRQILQCLGPIASRLAPRPASLAGDAHRNLALAVRQRSQKRARIAEVVTEVDPEKEKQARIKNNEDLNRNKNRRGGARRSGGGGRRRGMSAAYLEDEEEGAYDGVDLGRMKRRTLGRDRYDDEDDTEMEDYGDDGSGEEEDEWTKKKGRKRGAAAARASSRSKEEEDDSSEEGEVVFGDDDDDDDEEDVHVGKKRGGGTKKAVLEDDDDD